MVAPSFRGLRLPLWIVLLTATLSSSPSEAWILPGGGGTARLFSEFQSGGCLRRCGFSTLAGCRKGLPLRDSALGMAMDAGGLTIAVQHVLESAMVGSCEKRKCVGSLGSPNAVLRSVEILSDRCVLRGQVSCAWNGERKKDGEADEPLAKTRHVSRFCDRSCSLARARFLSTRSERQSETANIPSPNFCERHFSSAAPSDSAEATCAAVRGGGACRWRLALQGRRR
eukprot:3180755-Rhodomonas_salina.1